MTQETPTQETPRIKPKAEKGISEAQFMPEYSGERGIAQQGERYTFYKQAENIKRLFETGKGRVGDVQQLFDQARDLASQDMNSKQFYDVSSGELASLMGERGLSLIASEAIKLQKIPLIERMRNLSMESTIDRLNGFISATEKKLQSAKPGEKVIISNLLDQAKQIQNRLFH